ncbi:heme lyase CcmF/NrfE family subunit [Pelagibacterales bacterium SAG-MED31]|nr:heme lyase CcmF/NrfE family subunit [Pelagibacterales bacterium SAG-MED31]
MISLIGFSSLCLSIIFSLALLIPNSILKINIKFFLLIFRFSTILVCISFLSLVLAYINSDFSNFNVFQNSHSEKPFIYKISGAWGNHEGSILLWLCMISIYGFLFSLSSNSLDDFKINVLKIQSTLFIIFAFFIIFTSNPFLVNSILVNEGLGLNPILQDPALAIHPPTLYLGYVGFSLVFSLAIASLFNKKEDKNWIYETKKWSIVSWTFLTAGIALGSYWAYYELGWGGWWFWDPVENISLMPWIVGLALVHSLIMIRGEQIIERWIVFLSILCFSLSILGTFLVRSGILTSVHSFASDASRGLFILLIFFLTTGFGFLIFLIKPPKNNNNLNLLLINKTSALIINNILMIIAMLTILLGTIYPIIIEVMTNTRISVGGPYFNSTVLPVLLPGFLLMSIAPVLSWQSNKIKKFKVYVVFFLILSFVVFLHSYLTVFNTWGFIGLILGSWIILSSTISIVLRYKFVISFNYIKSINSFIAHIGVGIMIIGITFSSVYQKEYNFNISEGEEVKINENILKFEKLYLTEEKNYQSLRALFRLTKEDKLINYIMPGKNYYPVSKMITTEAGIYHDWLKDFYITLGSEDNNIWSISVYINPLVSFIWIGVFIMIFSGVIAIFKK